MISPIRKYADWLHTGWPAGTVEKLPEVRQDGTTNVPGLYVVGDLTGVPLLKFSSDSGAKAVKHIVSDTGFSGRKQTEDILDVAIVGAGVSGFAAALEAKKAGLKFTLFEAAEPFATISSFPKEKHIFTYPEQMTPAGELDFPKELDVKERLLGSLKDQLNSAGITPEIGRVDSVKRSGGILALDFKGRESIKAHRVIVGIGRSGNYRKLGVVGEELGKVSNRLHDPADFSGKDVLVVGGGDSALEAVTALASSGARVSLSYRKKELNRPKPENVDAVRAVEAKGDFPENGTCKLYLGTKPTEIHEDKVLLEVSDGQVVTIPNNTVLALVGREPPLDFFERSNVRVPGRWSVSKWLGLALFFGLCVWVYHWKKKYGWAFGDLVDPGVFWNALAVMPTELGRLAGDPSSILGTLRISMSSPGFYYTVVYSLVIVIFGKRRIARKKTPYVKWQTASLILIQCLPLFVLPELILPYAGHNGAFGDRYEVRSIDEQIEGAANIASDDSKVAYKLNRTNNLAYVDNKSESSSWLADQLFPPARYGHGREYWRAYGFVLAWPLFFSNLFTGAPLTLWLIISLAQTFLLIPLMVRKWGKGAYCGWICSCGAMAETLGDTHRHKMPHGQKWNKLNMLGQVFLGLALLILVFRVISWVAPSSFGTDAYNFVLFGKAKFASWPAAFRWLEYPLSVFNYAWFVDLLFAGILGMGLYFHFSGRVWCRFACPLAALMHIYARFSKFRIIADKKKCISCNQCTAVCHQGIDVMGFANKGEPMADPQCVRCSSCLYACPTGVLTFGEIDQKTGGTLKVDGLGASPVQAAEK